MDGTIFFLNSVICQ